MTDDQPAEENSAAEPGVAVVGGSEASPPPPPEAKAVPTGRPPRGRTALDFTSRTGPPKWLVPALAGVTVISVVLTILFAAKWSDLNSTNNSRTQVETVARDFLHALTNISPTNIDHEFQILQGYATGQFASQSNQFFGSKIRQELEQAQAKENGQVRYLYLQSLTDSNSQATVYAELDITYSNIHVTTPVPDVLQVVMAMTDTSNGWKVSNVTVLQPPTSSSSPTGSSGTSGTGG